MSKIRRVFPFAATGRAVFFGNLFAAQHLEIRVLSGRPDMVSGGSALVQLSGPPLDGVRVVAERALENTGKQHQENWQQEVIHIESRIGPTNITWQRKVRQAGGAC